MNAKLKFVLVGCGNIGRRHVDVLYGLPNVDLVGLCDVDEKKCSELAALYDSIPYFTSYEKMLSVTNPDAVTICTPHYVHADMAILAAERQINVLVEKPMALSVADCLRMIEAANKCNIILSVIKQNRYNVPVKLAKKALSEGKLGKVFMVKCDILWNRYQGYYDDSPWRGSLEKEGGGLFTQASHFIDLLIWWFGDVNEVLSYMETQNHTIETEDSGCAIMKFSSGTVGSLIWTTCVYDQNYEGSITIIGEAGTIKIGGKYLNRMEYWDVLDCPLPDTIVYNDKPNEYGKYQGTSSNHDKVIIAFIEKILKKDVEVVEGGEGMRSVAAIEKIYKMHRQRLSEQSEGV